MLICDQDEFKGEADGEANHDVEMVDIAERDANSMSVDEDSDDDVEWN